MDYGPESSVKLNDEL